MALISHYNLCPLVTFSFDQDCICILESSHFKCFDILRRSWISAHSDSKWLSDLDQQKAPPRRLSRVLCSRLFEQMMNARGWRSTRIISSLASAFINRGLIYQNSSLTSHQYVRLWAPPDPPIHLPFNQGYYGSILKWLGQAGSAYSSTTYHLYHKDGIAAEMKLLSKKHEENYF